MSLQPFERGFSTLRKNLNRGAFRKKIERFLNLDDQSTLSEGGMSEEDCGKEKKKKLTRSKEKKSKDDRRRRRRRRWEGKEGERVGGRGPVTSHDM